MIVVKSIVLVFFYRVAIVSDFIGSLGMQILPILLSFQLSIAHLHFSYSCLSGLGASSLLSSSVACLLCK
jgi:hypothetical protein